MPESSKSRFYKISAKVYQVLGIVFITVAFGLLMISLYPQIWYQINDEATASEITSLVLQTENLNDETKEDKEETKLSLPAFDSTLPKQNTLIIPNIQVNGPINENTDAYKGLLKGVWRVNDWGDPTTEYTMIIAAHRFGYISWTKDFRTKNSFYNLPKTRVGDRVQVIWEQRKYEYEIYKAEEGQQITDYSADIILYTCKMYNSPIRVFRYLNRVK